jgi:hypothetical protein
MSRVITVNKSIKDERLTDMFAQMTGAKAADPHIVIPKFNTLRKSAMIIIKTLEKFGNNDKMRRTFPSFIPNFDEILEYTKNLTIALQFAIVTEEQVSDDNIHVLYKATKECREVRCISVMCARLRKDMVQINDLNIHYIGEQADGSYTPFPFTNLNFYNLWTEISDIEVGGDKIKEYVLQVLKKIMEKSYEIQNIMVSPDIDVEEFSSVLVEAITKARGQLPRCQQAFDKIEEAVGTLRNNFGEYYKEFMISKKPNSILESFVSDVASKHKGNTRLKWQFMQIVNFYRKHSQGKIAKDSNLNYIFDTLDEHLDELGKATGDEKEEVKEEVKDNTVYGLHHIDMGNNDHGRYILVVEESRFDEFVQYLSANSNITVKSLSKLIDKYMNAIDKTPAIEIEGIYRTHPITDFDKFDHKAYISKITAT